MKVQKKNSLLVGYDTAGFLTGLSLGLRSVGWSVDRVGTAHPFGYENEAELVRPANSPNLTVDPILTAREAPMPDWFRSAILRFSTFSFRKKTYGLIGFIRLLPNMRRLRGYSLVIYNSGATLSGSRLEPWIARFFGAKIVVAFHGSDIRPVYLNGAMWRSKPMSLGDVRYRVKAQRRLARWAERHASLIVSWSGITHFFTKDLVFHETIGFPLVLPGNDPAHLAEHNKGASPSEVVRVLHMPTNPAAKGSNEIEEILNELVGEGLAISPTFLAGLSHKEALHAISQSDIVVDQIFADTASGVLAAESSILGKPVIIASKDRNWFAAVLGGDLPTTSFVKTMDVKSEIKRLSLSSKARNLAACAAGEYFSTWNPTEVAEKYIGLIYGKKLDRFYSPKGLTAARGGYAPAEEISEVVSSLVSKYGINALKLDHNPSLLRNVLNEFRKDSF